MVHLRLIVPTNLANEVTDWLRGTPGVAHLVRLPGAEAVPAGELLLCDVAREAANGVVEELQRRGVHHAGAITIESSGAVISDAAERASADAPGDEANAMVWEELETRARADATLSASFLIFMVIAALIAGIGILLDAPILIVGAMVVGPEYGPLSSLCVSVLRRRSRPTGTAAVTLLTGLVAASVGALVATGLFRVFGLAPDVYDVSGRELTSFISRPDAMAAVVAVLAGIVGMLSLTEARSGALIGVLVSVTTIPAAANIGVATAYAAWSEVVGASLQLVVNIAGLVIAGVATLAVQARVTSMRMPAPARERPASPAPG